MSIKQFCCLYVDNVAQMKFTINKLYRNEKIERMNACMLDVFLSHLIGCKFYELLLPADFM